MSLKQTPLHFWHVKHNAKMGEFATWDMPIQYKGILAEHEHTRIKASVFDISHMGEFLVYGENATEILSKAITQNLATLNVGKCRYGFLLTSEGTVLDDLIVYRVKEEEYLLVVNAACIENDFKILQERLSSLTLEDVSDKTGKIDLQGPLSLKVLEEITKENFKDLGYFSAKTITWGNSTIFVSRTGYTGELGYELYSPTHITEEVWEILTAHPDVEPAGLGARDTLRLEAGLSLYGHELDTEHTPTEAGLSSMLTSEADYIGKAGAMASPKEILIPLKAEGRRAARNGDLVALVNSPDEVIGKIVSGSYAPTIQASIAFAYVKAEYANNTDFLMKAAKTNIQAKRTDLPFYKNGTARKKL